MRVRHVGRSRPGWVGAGLVAVTFFVAARTDAQTVDVAPDLRNALEGIAADVAKFLKARRESSVSVGQFTGPPNFPSSAGPGLAAVLAEELRRTGLEVRGRAAVGVKGEYRITETEQYDPVTGRPTKVMAIVITGSLVDSFGEVLTDFRFERPGGPPGPTIPDEEAVVSLLGLPANLSGARPVERDRQLRRAYDDPPLQIAGETRVSAGADSPYAVEIIVKGRPCPILVEDGLPYVTLDRGDVYTIRLTNRSSLDASVEVLIDGLNVFTFSDVRHESGPKRGDPRYSFVVVPRGEQAVVHGWHRTNESVDTFQITEYARSAAAMLDHHADLGTVTVNFRAAWPPDDSPPPDEPPALKGAGDATGFGPPKDVRAEPVKRRSGRLRASVSIRYARPAS